MKLNVGSITGFIESSISRAIEKALPILLDELKRLTPEDTGNMVSSYRVLGVYKEGGSIKGKIENTAGYAIYVEYGVGGLTYTYHKPKGSPFYSGVGNRTFARAVDNVRNRVIDLIISECNK